MIKILLVDDDSVTSLLLKRFLEVEGFIVSYAENGATGWNMFSVVKPDLILLDINMPELNGFELAEKIRKIDSKVVIFFLSDRTEKIDRLRGFSLKGNDYIPKPFYPEELVAKINERFQTTECYKFSSTSFTPLLCKVESAGLVSTLSLRQTQILEMLCLRVNTIVDRTEILEKVWGNNSAQNSLALNVQITYLRGILKPDPLLTIISFKGRGYMLKFK